MAYSYLFITYETNKCVKTQNKNAYKISTFLQYFNTSNPTTIRHTYCSIFIGLSIKKLILYIFSSQQAYIKSESNLEQPKPAVLLSFKQFTAHWKTEGEEQSKIPALSDINLNVSIFYL